MHNITITQWRGNKDVPLLSLSMPSVPRIEDYLEFRAGGKEVKGKVTRVSYKISTDNQGDQSIVETQVRINAR